MTTSLPTTLGDGACAIATHALVKHYGHEPALQGIDLQVPNGVVYVLIGPNGAGKTTTLKILLDLLRATSGSAEILGLDTRELAPQVRAQIGYVPESNDWGHAWMRVGRLLLHHAAYFPAWDAQYAALLSEQFELRLDKKLGQLSKGQRRRVHLALALAHRPAVLILDEPTDGLDPIMRDETLRILSDHIAENGTTVLISTHHVHEVEQLADHVGMMRNGRLLTQTSRQTMDRMLRRYRAEIPENWPGAPQLNGAVAQRAGIGREIQWLVWGEEQSVRSELTSAGASVRDVAHVSLEEATLALLGRKDVA